MLYKLSVCKGPSFFPYLLSDYLKHYATYMNNRLIAAALYFKHIFGPIKGTLKYMTLFPLFLHSLARNKTRHYIPSPI